MQTGCTWYLGAATGVPDNSASETANIRLAVQEVANETHVDERFILAILMQESRGCVRIPSTTSTHPNPGLMQSHAGTWTCADRGTDPCPWESISGMIRDGVAGTPEGDGLAAILQQQQVLGYGGAQLYFRAARVYNSGSIDDGQQLERGAATHCYVSNIANRLTGWASNQASYDCPWDDTMVVVSTPTPDVSTTTSVPGNTTLTISLWSTPVTVTAMTSVPATLWGSFPNASNAYDASDIMNQLPSSCRVVC